MYISPGPTLAVNCQRISAADSDRAAKAMIHPADLAAGGNFTLECLMNRWNIDEIEKGTDSWIEYIFMGNFVEFSKTGAPMNCGKLLSAGLTAL